MKSTKSLKVTRDIHRTVHHFSVNVAGTGVLRRGDDIRETLGVQACGPNLDDDFSTAVGRAAKPAKSHSIY